MIQYHDIQLVVGTQGRTGYMVDRNSQWLLTY